MIEDKWLKVQNAPQDSDDPYVIGARRRMEYSGRLAPALTPLGKRPWFVDSADAPGVLAELRALDCEIKELDARGMDEEALLTEVGVLYGFAEGYGESWGAYNDCYPGFAEAGDVPVVLAISGFDEWNRNEFRRFFQTVYNLESTTELFAGSHQIVARTVVNLYIGDWN
ncbi:hypothetical protein KGQ20_00110 [Catenulispora sp. NF23]|uniref:Barstar (barnase inhibitor) domain-containing protein n=1 Tax=Catenulispora pinistramenti TaxID=2705254 RepID=A0ABS5KJ49_9ACTN|nr:hypothetical protein [Catenulispora pinistramenti]MBS2531168.1 hypothetical protein [Catenulispora pinistramenti]MBS2545930.1 hypothetical protein [Catenulispora pinistramenti]